MKLIETISDVLTDVGIFQKIQSLASTTLTFITAEEAQTLDTEYYLNHSGQKKISPLYEYLIENDENNALEKCANIIIKEYVPNWVKTYNALFASYDPIQNYSMTETDTPNITTTETPNITNQSTDKQSTNVTTSGGSDTSTYGFNSDESVNADAGTSTQTVTADKDENVKETSSTETGTRTTTQTGSRTLIRSGNIGVTTSQQMINSEIELRKFDFYNMIMLDIDKIMCRQVY